MEKRCGVCGETKALTEFHRWKRGDGHQVWCKVSRKVYDAAYAARRLCKARILEEIAKCDLVCANCHAVRTVSRRSIGV